ncbi:methyltransferase [Fodinicola feengrottensis]|uniref:Methyltransferase n=1 Tax=Fodinicola feengrottensis TaxID=435914 RepID=A0ABP4V125_9ACTN
MPTPTSPTERVAFGLNAAPGPVLDYVGALGLRAVFVAVRVGIFQALDHGPRTAEDLAAKLDLDPRGTETLLDALESIGYARSRAGAYEPTAMAARWMPKFSAGVDFYEWMAADGWSDLPARLRGEAGDPGSRTWVAGDSADENFAGMVSNARFAADEVVRRISFAKPPRRLLDIGGGHGVFAARFVEKHSEMRATVLDTEDVLKRSVAVQAEEGVADRVELRTGDFWTDDWGTGYDAVLLFNLLNAYPLERKLALLDRARAALAPGGQLVILDQMRRSVRSGAARAVVELTNLRLFDPGTGGTYTLPELREWLAHRRMEKVRNHRLFSVPWTALVAARRPLDPTPDHEEAHR